MHLTCHGFYAATTDTAAIKLMFTGHPDRLVAVRTGGPSGLVVVDVDPRSGGSSTLVRLENGGLLPPTLRAITGGAGLHLLYAHPGGHVQGGAGKLGVGVDVKADGGYFVAAPSVHPTTGLRYRWAESSVAEPAPLHPALLERLRPTIIAPTSVGPRPPGGGGGRGRLLGVLTALAETPESQRNDMLYWAAKRVGVMHREGALPDLGAAVATMRDVARRIGLTDSEIGDENRGTIRSGLIAAVSR